MDNTKKKVGRPSVGKKRYNIMCFPSRIEEVRAYIKTLENKTKI